MQRGPRNIEMQLHQAWPVCEAEEREGGVANVQVEIVGLGAAESRRSRAVQSVSGGQQRCDRAVRRDPQHGLEDRKSTRLNSSHLGISYAVFCLKKKNLQQTMNNIAPKRFNSEV